MTDVHSPKSPRDEFLPVEKSRVELLRPLVLVPCGMITRPSGPNPSSAGWISQTR